MPRRADIQMDTQVTVGKQKITDKPIQAPERGPATEDAAIPARVSVEVDTLITRADLGPTCTTFVAAGQNIPVGLESYPRTPAG